MVLVFLNRINSYPACEGIVLFCDIGGECYFLNGAVDQSSQEKIRVFVGMHTSVR